MTRALDEVNALHLGARCRWHTLECAGSLINTPVTLPSDKHRRHIECAVGEQLQLGIVFSRQSDAVAVEPSLKARALVLADIDAQLVVGHPPASRYLRR